MVEPEIAFCKLEELLEIEEQYVSYIVQTTLRERAAELKAAGARHDRIWRR